MLLSDKKVQHAKPKDSAYTLKDGQGLSLRVEPSGAKLWHFRFYWQCKQQRISFGKYPDVNLKAARQRRDDARTMIASGVDPRGQQAARPDDVFQVTFRDFVERWKALKLKKLGAIRSRTVKAHGFRLSGLCIKTCCLRWVICH